MPVSFALVAPAVVSDDNNQQYYPGVCHRHPLCDFLAPQALFGPDVGPPGLNQVYHRPVARAIVRYSINGEGSNVTGNEARGLLQQAGFERHGRTAAFEAEDLDVPSLMAALRALLDTLENPPGGGAIDHLWVYVDQADDSN